MEQPIARLMLCSVLASNAQGMSMWYYKCLCSAGRGSRKAGDEITRGIWDDGLERNQEVTNVGPAANLEGSLGKCYILFIFGFLSLIPNRPG